MIFVPCDYGFMVHTRGPAGHIYGRKVGRILAACTSDPKDKRAWVAFDIHTADGIKGPTLNVTVGQRSISISEDGGKTFRSVKRNPAAGRAA